MKSESVDPSLLRAARDGDPFAWAEFYDDCQPRISAYLRMMGDPGLAGDEPRLWRAVADDLSTADEPEDPRSFALGVAVRERDRSADPGGAGSEDLAALTVLEREVLALRVGAGLSEEETAAALHRPLTVVKAAGHRAVAAIGREMT